MDIVKRDGTKVKFTASKVQTRVEKASKGLKVDPHTVLLGVYSGIADNMKTYEIDELIAKISAGYTTLHGDYSKLSARILESSIEKSVGGFFEQNEKLFIEVFDDLIEIYMNAISKNQKLALELFWNFFTKYKLDSIDTEKSLSLQTLWFRCREKKDFDEKNILSFFHIVRNYDL